MPRDFFRIFYFPLIKKFNINKENSDEMLKNWILKYGETDKSKKEFIWSLMNFIINDLPKKFTSINLYQKLIQIHKEQSIFLTYEKKKHTHISKLISHYELLLNNWEDYTICAQIIASHCCDECEKIDGIVHSVESEFKNQTLPYINCKRELGCICNYGFFAVRDLEGKLIPKIINS